jgi:hypothetical protein
MARHGRDGVQSLLTSTALAALLRVVPASSVRLKGNRSRPG